MRRWSIARTLAVILAVEIFVPTTPMAPAPPPNHDVLRVYVQLKNRCGSVLQDPQFQASPNRRGLYAALKRCVGNTHQDILKEIGKYGPALYSRSILLSNALVVDVNRKQRLALMRDPLVAYVVLPSPVILPRPDPHYLLETSACPPMTKASRAVDKISIGIIDSGLNWNEQPYIHAHYRGSSPTNPDQADHQYNWLDAFQGCPPNEPCDLRSDRHGTIVAGIVNAEIGNEEPITFFACRDGGTGNGTDAALHACLDFLLAPTDPTGGNRDRGADIINASQGGCRPTTPTPGPTPTGTPDLTSGQNACADINLSLEKLRAANVVVIAAAGETDLSPVIDSMPAMSPHALTVGGVIATAAQGTTLSPNSPIGPGVTPCKPDFVARPSADYEPVGGAPGTCRQREGSSYEAPRVAVQVARLWLNVPALRGDAKSTLEILRQSRIDRPEYASPLQCTSSSGTPTATPGASTVPNRQFGYGEIDVTKAIELGKAMTPSPTPTPTHPGGP